MDWLKELALARSLAWQKSKFAARRKATQGKAHEEKQKGRASVVCRSGPSWSPRFSDFGLLFWPYSAGFGQWADRRAGLSPEGRFRLGGHGVGINKAVQFFAGWPDCSPQMRRGFRLRAYYGERRDFWSSKEYKRS
jgi:hypothetical protein